MKIRIVKIGQPSRYMYSVKSVNKENKYSYFVITTSTLHHEIIQTIPFRDCDYIECYDDKTSDYGMFTYVNGKDKPIKVVRSND